MPIQRASITLFAYSPNRYSAKFPKFGSPVLPNFGNQRRFTPDFLKKGSKYPRGTGSLLLVVVVGNGINKGAVGGEAPVVVHGHHTH